MTPASDTAEDQDGGPVGLAGQLLIAMPSMGDPRFERAVIYICAHNEDGAMGLVVNKPMPSINFPELLGQLGIEVINRDDDRPVHFGGPVDSERGFVLHSTDVVRDGSLVVDDQVALTATIDILKSIAAGEGPRRHILALGYAGWGAGQLDSEIQANGWLIVEPDENLLFGPDWSTKWERSFAKLGIDAYLLSGESGHA